MPFTESNYENAVLKLFTDVLDYSYAYGPDIDRDYHDPLYEDLLFPALQRINPGLSEVPLPGGDRCLGRLSAAAQLHVRDPVPVYLQSGLRHERLDHLQGGHHHLRRGSFHGVEGQGWQL